LPQCRNDYISLANAAWAISESGRCQTTSAGDRNARGPRVPCRVRRDGPFAPGGSVGRVRRLRGSLAGLPALSDSNVRRLLTGIGIIIRWYRLGHRLLPAGSAKRGAPEPGGYPGILAAEKDHLPQRHVLCGGPDRRCADRRSSGVGHLGRLGDERPRRRHRATRRRSISGADRRDCDDLPSGLPHPQLRGPAPRHGLHRRGRGHPGGLRRLR
jgi:hypothetical protein